MIEKFDIRVNTSTPQPPKDLHFEAGVVSPGTLSQKKNKKLKQAKRTFKYTQGNNVAKEQSVVRNILPHRISNSSVPEADPKKLIFGRVVNAIYQHASLPSRDPMAVDPVTADYSVALLGFLAYNYNIDIPKFSPREGENVLFRWDRDRFSHYLTITSEGVSLMGLDPANRRRCKYDIEGKYGLDRIALAKALVQATSSSTALAADDA